MSMDGNLKRQKRTGSTSLRYRPSRLVPVEAGGAGHVGTAAFAACGAVVIIACTIVALIWIVAMHEMQEQRTEVRERAEQTLSGQAATIAETVAHELLMIDQSLAIIQEAWKTDSRAVDLQSWRKQMPALLTVADDLFIADEDHVIRQDILPRAVGQGVGAAYVTFRHGSLEQLQGDGTTDDAAAQGGTQWGTPIDARQFLMYVMRPLDHPAGWIVGASYRSQELPKLFAGAALGYNPVVGLVDTGRGVLQAVVGRAARQPRTDLSETQLYSVMARAPSGVWLGETAIDGIQRLHAFHRVAGHDVAVLVGENWAEVMAPADNLAAGDRALAFVGSGLVAVITILVLWALYTVRNKKRHKRMFDRNKNELDRLRADEGILSGRAQINAARLQAVLDGTSDGIALFDAALRLVQWNDRFSRNIRAELRDVMPLDTLVRNQVANNLFGSVADAEVEIARRVGLLRTGEAAGLAQPSATNGTLILRGAPIAEGGLMLILNDLVLSGEASLGKPDASIETDKPAIAEPAASHEGW